MAAEHEDLTNRPARRAWHRQFVMWVSGLGIGWVLSILIHAGLLTTAIVYKPFREALFERPEPKLEAVQASSDTVQEVSEYIRDENATALQQTVQNLEAIERMLDELRQEKLVEYASLEQRLIAEAPERALEAQKQALEAQKQTIDLQTQTNLGEAVKQQAVVDARQEQAQRALDMMGPDAAPSAEAQRVANQKQAEADTRALEARKASIDAPAAQDRVESAKRELEKARSEAESRQKRVDAAAAEVQAKAAQVETIREKAASEASRMEEAVTARDKAQAELAEARKAKAADLKAKEDASKKAEAQARSRSQDARRASEQQARAERDLKGLETRRDREQTALVKAQEKVQAAETKVTELTKTASGKAAEAKAVAEAARAAQEEARRAQEAANAQLKQAILDGLKARKESQVAEKTLPPTPSESPAPQPPLGKNLAELYAEARASETRITETYRELRAAELAIIREVGLDEAKAQTDVPVPVRPDLDTSLLTAKARETAKLEAQKREIATAVREGESMVALGSQLLNTALGAKFAQAQGMSAQGSIALAASADRLAQVTDDGGEARDLTALTKGTAPDAEAAGEDGADGRSGDGAPQFTREQLRGIVPARRFVRGANGAQLVYIDSWYVIGPFDNPGRKNINQVFPPESVIDLDAVYLGAGGQPITWQFAQNTNPMLQPVNWTSWTIYYAYTEVYFDDPMDLWVAVGSDDFSKIWLNGELVYVSGQEHKEWQVAETWRKLHFKQGVNRILYRIENGQHGMGWSMVLAMKK